MFRFIYKSLLHHRTTDSSTKHICFLQTVQSVSSIPHSSNASDSKSLTVSYLTNSCGLSLESAITASKTVNIKNTDRPDSVLKLFEAHGFTKSHIARLISKYPRLILTDPEKIIRPKIEFFESLGIVGTDLPRFLCSNRDILRISLKNHIIPVLDFLKGFVETNENLIQALRQSSRIIGCSIQKVIDPNISTLRANGVPETNIAKLITMQPQSLMMRTDLFHEVVNEVREMGFDPMRRSFILAVRVMSMISRVKWERKKEVLMSFGWCEDKFISAFKVQPALMLCSEKKIVELTEFLVNKFGLKPSDVSRCPNLFLTSLEKRIIPRCSVLQVLTSKGLINKDVVDVVWVLNLDKKKFEQKFVDQFKEDVPEVMKAYQGEMGFQRLNFLVMKEN